MKKNHSILAMLALMLAFVLFGCSNPAGGGDNDPPPPAPRSGTVLLTETGTHTFTITLDGFVWQDTILIC